MRSSLRIPKSGKELVSRWPTVKEWTAELKSGWRGSDGSSSSFDNIEGIVIGTTSKDYLPKLPANWHDYCYRVIRRLYTQGLITEEQRYLFQLAADRAHYAALLDCLSHLVGYNGWKARRRAYIRYWSLRWLGKSSTLTSIHEEYIVEL